MFTGIVEEMGAVTSLEQTLGGVRLTILASTVLADLKLGDSVSINGACHEATMAPERRHVTNGDPPEMSDQDTAPNRGRSPEKPRWVPVTDASLRRLACAGLFGLGTGGGSSPASACRSTDPK